MHTDEELREMAKHVVYEIQEFNGSIAACAKFGPADKKLDPHSWNRSLESALLHFRNLRGFFIDPPSGADVSAQDYVSTWSGNGSPIFDATRKALNKHLSHLSWERVHSTAQNWDLDAMKEAIDQLVQEFKKRLTALDTNWFAPTASTGNRPIPDKEGNSTVSWSRPGSLL